MKRLLLALCALCMIFAATAPVCAIEASNGVLSEERVINLPNDQGKWYISIVGETKNPQYQTILKWFESDSKLYALRRQVHYIPVTTDKAVYQSRYSMNVKGLPTVRLQNSEGVVVYEAAGENLPFTAGGLYGALANNVASVQGRPFLPWRKNNACPCPWPNPEPDPVPDPNTDPEPGPLDDGDAPAVEPVSPLADFPPLWLMFATLGCSAIAGVVVEWRATYATK